MVSGVSGSGVRWRCGASGGVVGRVRGVVKSGVRKFAGVVAIRGCCDFGRFVSDVRLAWRRSTFFCVGAVF